MLQKNVVIVVFDESYGKRFLSAAISRKQKNVNYYLFHDISQLEKFSKEQEISYLILDSEISFEVRSGLQAKKKLLLVEELEELEKVDEDAQEDIETNKGKEKSQEVLIYKYQEIDKILKKVFQEVPPKTNMNIKSAGKNHQSNHQENHETSHQANHQTCHQANHKSNHQANRQTNHPSHQGVNHHNKHQKEEFSKYKKEGKVIGIYSPIHRIGKTNFAIHLGKEIAKSEAVLYLNFEPFASGSYFKKESVGNMENLLYSANQEYQNLGLTISAMAGQIEKLDYINPMPIMEDLFKVSGKDWKEVILRILEQSIYTTIILDLSDGVKELFSILSFCDTIYTLYIDEPIALGKLKRYTDNLIRTGYDSVLEHTIQKKVEWM